MEISVHFPWGGIVASRRKIDKSRFAIFNRPTFKLNLENSWVSICTWFLRIARLD
jgi:hypothetical protein